MEINYIYLFAPWKPEDQERVVVSGLNQEKDATPYIEKINLRLAGMQLKTKKFYTFKVVKFTYGDENAKELARVNKINQENKEKYEKEVLENKQTRIENLKNVDLIVFRVALVSGVILFGFAFCMGRGKNQKMVFLAAVVVPSVAYPSLKSYGYSYYPEVLPEKREPLQYIEKNYYDLILSLQRDDRILPPNFKREEDIDPITLEPIPEEDLYSPLKIFLPNYVVDSRDFVRSVLEKGTLRHTLDNREFNQEELKSILGQISKIFLITPSQFWKCFDLEVAHQNSLGHGLDCHGRYTEEAKSAIKYSFDGIKDSALPEIDEFFEGIERKWTPILGLIGLMPRFQEFFSRVSHATIDPNEFLSLMLMHGVFPADMLELRMNEGDHIPIPVNLAPFFVKILLGLYGPDCFKRQRDQEICEMKDQRIRAIRLEILGMTHFNQDMRKMDRKSARINYFEKLTGVSLSENGGGTTG